MHTTSNICIWHEWIFHIFFSRQSLKLIAMVNEQKKNWTQNMGKIITDGKSLPKQFIKIFVVFKLYLCNLSLYEKKTHETYWRCRNPSLNAPVALQMKRFWLTICFYQFVYFSRLSTVVKIERFYKFCTFISGCCLYIIFLKSK